MSCRGWGGDVCVRCGDLCPLSAASMSGGVVNVAMESGKGGKSEEVQCDVLLVCVGRKPYTDNLGLEVIISSEREVVSNSGSTV